MNKLILFLMFAHLTLSSCDLFKNSSEKEDIPMEGLVAYWSLDDSTSDNSGNGHDYSFLDQHSKPESWGMP